MNSESTPFYRMSEFWIAVVDALVNIVMLILVEFAPSQTVELVQQIIVLVQPIVIMIIVSMLGARVVNGVQVQVNVIKSLLVDDDEK